jgi:sec-independent protein translocase protein TatC
MAQQVQTIEPQDPFDGSQMTLMEHLIELRVRLMWIVGAIAVGTIIAMFFANGLIDIIASPLQNYNARLQVLGPPDLVFIFLKVSFTVGSAIAMPVIVYQVMAFVAPGLYPHEKRALFLMLPGIIVLFILGVVFAFYILVPVAVGFLQTFLTGDNAINTDWAIDRYIGFVTRIVFWIGVSFEMPLVITALARIGLVSGKQLLGFWRHAIIVIAIIAAIITPTIDPVNMAIVMAPLFVLYMLSVGMAYLVYKPREPRDFSD